MWGMHFLHDFCSGYCLACILKNGHFSRINSVPNSPHAVFRGGVVCLPGAQSQKWLIPGSYFLSGKWTFFFSFGILFSFSCTLLTGDEDAEPRCPQNSSTCPTPNDTTRHNFSSQLPLVPLRASLEKRQFCISVAYLLRHCSAISQKLCKSEFLWNW